MKIKLIALSLCLFTGVNLVKAQEASKNFTPSENKHEFRLSVSDGLTQSTVDVRVSDWRTQLPEPSAAMSVQAWCTDWVTATR